MSIDQFNHEETLGNQSREIFDFGRMSHRLSECKPDFRFYSTSAEP